MLEIVGVREGGGGLKSISIKEVYVIWKLEKYKLLFVLILIEC